MATYTDQLVHQASLTRYPMGHPDELGALSFWNQTLQQMYGQHPFPAFMDELDLILYHMDHPELDRMTAQRLANLQDFDTNAPGCQTAAGLYHHKDRLELGLFPYSWQADYTGPARGIPESSRLAARKTLCHEAGHFHADLCRFKHNDDDISRLLTNQFLNLRPHKAAGDNEDEDWAEVFRAILGSDETRGMFSDGQPFSPTAELRSLMRCAYWLAGNLRGCWVANLTPGAGGCMFQLWVGLGWRWRWVSAEDWHSEEWTGSSWVRI
ncbi:MAG: hypothetical protein ACO1RX_20260 [Candidatus Sericytochromatia bacterium]